MHFVCLVGISRGTTSALTSAQFEWQRNGDEAKSLGRVTLSYGAEQMGLHDAQIRQVISRERVRDAVMMLVGQDSAGYPPVLMLHLRDADPLQIVFSQYTVSPPCDWRGVITEIVSGWGNPLRETPLNSVGGTAGLVSAGALGPPAEDAMRTMRQQQMYLQGPAVLNSFQKSGWAEGPMPLPMSFHGAIESHGSQVLSRSTLHIFGDAALAGHGSIGDESAIAHAIVLFISHARVSKDCRGGRSRKAYRSHMTHTALAAMCAAAEAVVAADLISARAATAETGKAPVTVEHPSEAISSATPVRDLDVGLLSPLPPLELLSILPSQLAAQMHTSALAQNLSAAHAYAPPPMRTAASPSSYGGGDGGRNSPSNRSQQQQQQHGAAAGDGAGVGAEVARAIYAVTEERAIALGYKSRTDLQRLLLRVALEAIALEMLSHRRMLCLSSDTTEDPLAVQFAAVSALSGTDPFSTGASGIFSVSLAQAAAVAKGLGRGSWPMLVSRLVVALEATGNGNDRYMSDTLRSLARPWDAPVVDLLLVPAAALAPSLSSPPSSAAISCGTGGQSPSEATSLSSALSWGLGVVGNLSSKESPASSASLLHAAPIQSAHRLPPATATDALFLLPWPVDSQYLSSEVDSGDVSSSLAALTLSGPSRAAPLLLVGHTQGVWSPSSASSQKGNDSSEITAMGAAASSATGTSAGEKLARDAAASRQRQEEWEAWLPQTTSITIASPPIFGTPAVITNVSSVATVENAPPRTMSSLSETVSASSLISVSDTKLQQPLVDVSITSDKTIEDLTFMLGSLLGGAINLAGPSVSNVAPYALMQPPAQAGHGLPLYGAGRSRFQQQQSAMQSAQRRPGGLQGRPAPHSFRGAHAQPETHARMASGASGAFGGGAGWHGDRYSRPTRDMGGAPYGYGPPAWQTSGAWSDTHAEQAYAAGHGQWADFGYGQHGGHGQWPASAHAPALRPPPHQQFPGGAQWRYDDPAMRYVAPPFLPPPQLQPPSSFYGAGGPPGHGVGMHDWRNNATGHGHGYASGGGTMPMSAPSGSVPLSGLSSLEQSPSAALETHFMPQPFPSQQFPLGRS